MLRLDTIRALQQFYRLVSSYRSFHSAGGYCFHARIIKRSKQKITLPPVKPHILCRASSVDGFDAWWHPTVRRMSRLSPFSLSPSKAAFSIAAFILSFCFHLTFFTCILLCRWILPLSAVTSGCERNRRRHIELFAINNRHSLLSSCGKFMTN